MKKIEEFYKKNQKKLNILFLIIGISFFVFYSLYGQNSYKKDCDNLINTNREIADKLDTMDSNSSEWNVLFDKTENENPQLIECLYPTDSSSDNYW